MTITDVSIIKDLVGSSPRLVDFDNIENNECGDLGELEYDNSEIEWLLYSVLNIID